MLCMAMMISACTKEGPEGKQGAKGAKGERGERGERGLQGETGPQDPAGPQEIQGIPGNAGVMMYVWEGPITIPRGDGHYGFNILFLTEKQLKNSMFFPFIW